MFSRFWMKGKMVQKRKKSSVCKLEVLNGQIEEFFKACESKRMTGQEVRDLCYPLRIRLLREISLKVFILMSILIIVLWTLKNISFINWNLSALGRLLLIKILPYWDWTYLYNEKCLLNYPEKEPIVEDTSKPVNFLLPEECSVCEKYDFVPEITNTPNFTHLNEDFLSRGLAVIINDQTDLSPGNFLELLLNINPVINSFPCDLKSNLIFNRKVNLKDLMEKAKSSPSFYFHFRNCQFSAVKGSRLIGARPDFYSPHLDPAYTSWVLVNQKHDTDIEHPLVVEGLIHIRQLRGDGRFTLSVRKECAQICKDFIDVKLKQGMGLLFTTDLWKLSYFPKTEGLDDFNQSVSFITETHWT